MSSLHPPPALESAPSLHQKFSFQRKLRLLECVLVVFNEKLNVADTVGLPSGLGT